MNALPIWGRNGHAVMEQLLPGSTPNGAGGFYESTSFNGVPSTVNNFHIDGNDADNYFSGFSWIMPAQENLEEMSIITSVPDASFGRGAGGQIEAVMKSGTNHLHGQLWGYFQDGDWGANSWQNNWMNVPRPLFSQKWFGGNVGGPVYIPRVYNGKNKTFFFTSYERTSTTQGSTTTFQTMFDAERAGDFSNSTHGIPTLNGVPTPQLPASLWLTMGKYLASHTEVLPRPTSGVNTYTWNPTWSSLERNFSGKIDHYFSDRHRLFGSLWWPRLTPTFDNKYYIFSQQSAYSQFPNPKATWGLPYKRHVWTLNDTYTISPTMLNNFIVGTQRATVNVDNTYNPADALFTAKDLGVGAVGDYLAPDIQKIVMPGMPGSGGIQNGYVNQMTMNIWHVADNFSWIKGRHTVKMGVEIRYYHEVKNQTSNAGGVIVFADGRQSLGGTGNGWADMLLGKAVQFSQNNTQSIDVYYPAREGYIQDTFKASSRLTLTFGARWEPHFGVHSATGALSTFRAGQAFTVFPTAPLGLVAVGDQGVPANTYGTKWADIGPRASFAWDIFGNGRAALHGGYGLMTDYQNLLGFTTFATSLPFGVSYAPKIETLNLANPYAEYGSVPFPWKTPVAGDPRNSSIVFPSIINTLGFDKDFNSAAIHQFNATLDFEPVKSYLFSVGYVGTRSTHLGESHDLNFPRFLPGASLNTTDNQRARRPYFPVGFESITMSYADFNAMYNSLQTRFTKRLSHGLTFMGHYTLSSNRYQRATRDLTNLALDYYSPGLDQRFALAWSYDLPIPKGSTRSSKMFLGGWTFGGSASANSGGYGNVGYFNCNAVNFGSAGCYATFVGGTPYASNSGNPKLDSKGTQLGVTYLDPTKFLAPNQVLVNGVPQTSAETGKRLFLGNSTVGTWRGPGAFTLNGSLNKAFAFSESKSANVRLEVFNALNHVNLNNPGATLSTDLSLFGVITSAQDPRKIQISTRFVF